jgi:hypothetical protein
MVIESERTAGRSGTALRSGIPPYRAPHQPRACTRNATTPGCQNRHGPWTQTLMLHAAQKESTAHVVAVSGVASLSLNETGPSLLRRGHAAQVISPQSNGRTIPHQTAKWTECHK